MGGYVRISRVVKTLLGILLKVWAYSGLVLVFCFLLYYFYGGMCVFVLLIFAATGILYHAEDNFLYYPELPSHSRVFVPIPSMYGLPYENIQVRTADGVMLHMFFIHQPAERKHQSPTIVFLHGNAGNMGHRLQNAVGLYHNLHCNILLVEYRGYGLSEGNPSEDGFYIDARTSIDYLYTRNDINVSEIIVYGRSLGGAVAIDLASRAEYSSKIWCLVVENTFTSIPDMAKVLLGWKLLHYFPVMCYKNKFLSLFKVMHLRVPTLFISGLSDTLVPPRMMTDLHSRCGSVRKQLLQIQTGTHNDTWTVKGYYHSLAVFLQNNRLHSVETSKTNIQTTCQQIDKSSDWCNVHII